MNKVVDKLIKHFGNQTKVAVFLQTKTQNVSYWHLHGDIPLRLLPKCAKELGVTLHDLRPDIYE
jgi:hypothetical protein